MASKFASTSTWWWISITSKTHVHDSNMRQDNEAPTQGQLYRSSPHTAMLTSCGFTRTMRMMQERAYIMFKTILYNVTQPVRRTFHRRVSFKSSRFVLPLNGWRHATYLKPLFAPWNVPHQWHPELEVIRASFVILGKIQQFEQN